MVDFSVILHPSRKATINLKISEVNILNSAQFQASKDSQPISINLLNPTNKEEVKQSQQADV